MVCKRENTIGNYNCDTISTNKSENITDIAKKLLINTKGKDMYYLGGNPIRNFHELKNNINFLNLNHVNYLANWIAYLGDTSTAEQIQKNPENFKKIISTRYSELKKHM